MPVAQSALLDSTRSGSDIYLLYGIVHDLNFTEEKTVCFMYCWNTPSEVSLTSIGCHTCEFWILSLCLVRQLLIHVHTFPQR